MWKNKKTKKQKILKRIAKFFVNDKPMSQVIHWGLILTASSLFAINIVRAADILKDTVL